MSKGREEYPADVLSVAAALCRELDLLPTPNNMQPIAKAIIRERSRPGVSVRRWFGLLPAGTAS